MQRPSGGDKVASNTSHKGEHVRVISMFTDMNSF